MHLLLFDIDGTLIRGRVGRNALAHSFADLFQVDAKLSPGVSGVIFNGRSDNAILQDMVLAFGIEPGRFEDEKEAFLRRYYEHLEEGVRTSPDLGVLPGVQAVLDTLHGRAGLGLGLLTGNLERGARIKLEGLGLSDYFAFGGYAEDGLDRKDIALAAYRRGCRHLGADVPPERVLVVGDTEHDVTAAKAHGFTVVGVATGGVACSDLASRGADFCFETLENGFMDTLTRWLDS